MDAIMLENGWVRFIVDNIWLAQFGITIDHMEKSMSYSCEIYESLLEYAEKKFKVSFNHDIGIYYLRRIADDKIEMDIKPESNIIYMHNDFIDDHNIAEGIRRLLCNLPDDKIKTSHNSEVERLNYINKLRTDTKFVRTELI